jgi:hypothetical protein
VVARQERDRHPLAGLTELAEERGASFGDPRELGGSLAIRQLPEAEGIADDDELGGRRARSDVREELDQLALEIASGESPVASDVEVTDEVIGRRHRDYSPC